MKPDELEARLKAMREHVEAIRAKSKPRTKPIVEPRDSLIPPDWFKGSADQPAQEVPSQVLSQDKFKIGPKLREFMDGEPRDTLPPTPRKPKP